MASVLEFPGALIPPRSTRGQGADGGLGWVLPVPLATCPGLLSSSPCTGSIWALQKGLWNPACTYAPPPQEKGQTWTGALSPPVRTTPPPQLAEAKRRTNKNFLLYAKAKNSPLIRSSTNAEGEKT